jgi:hypothetical protein
VTVPASKNQLIISLGFYYFFTTIKTGWADVMTQMHFAGCGFDRTGRCSDKVVRTVHATLGWGFFILLNSHGGSPKKL